MLKLALILLIGTAVVALPPRPLPPGLVRSANNPDTGDGSYNFGYQTHDGTMVDQQGELRSGILEDGTVGEYVAQMGSYSYTIGGILYTVTYTADEEGFKPVITKTRAI